MPTSINLSLLNQKELLDFNSLVRLGDSEKLAFDTVIELRKRDYSYSFYKNAYEN